MIPESIPITPGLLVRDDEGVLHRVEDTRPDADFHKNDRAMGRYGRIHRINYEQLEAGSSFPAGSTWSRSEWGFRILFTIEEVSGIEEETPGL